ncbi:MAG: extracellular solute-binding protein [Bacteroidetes bacterium]|nr:extracellular solute-binding protein [Bacteroidota bacterium]
MKEKKIEILKSKRGFTSLMIIGIFIAFMAIYYFLSTPALKVVTDDITEIYFADHISAAHRKVISLFNKKYEGKIKVIPIDLSFDHFSTNERKELLSRSFRSKSDRVDIFAVDQIWVQRFEKWAEPLDKGISRQQRDAILNFALESCYVDSTLMASPFILDIALMYYRQDILETLPNYKEIKSKLDNSINWEELIELSRNKMFADNPFYTFQADEYEGLVCSFIEAVLNQNRNYFDGGNTEFNSAEVRNALTLLVNLVNKYSASPHDVTDFVENASYEYFLKNDGVFLRAWPSFNVSLLNEYKPLAENFKIAKCPLPHFKGTKPASVFGGWNLMISKYSKYKNEAMEFIKFVLSKEVQLVMYKEGGYLPILKNSYSSEKIAADENLKQFYNIMINGVHRPQMEDYTRISDILAYYANKAIKKEISVDEAIREASELIQSKKVIIK